MICNATRDTVIASSVETARNFWQRSKGLLGRTQLPLNHALVIPHCESIHMFFMKFPIDVIFCDRKDKVVGLCEGIKPFRLSPVFFRASYAIELPAGTIIASQTRIGDQVRL
ncbi:MAG: DUF192 domain-containing protein [Candidatus Omnitrophica bacterium]|nr:DUF192 domain-containing protein [Candidatus Omnitrophota bacterium]MDE2009523.1 DUF192 domain-containing protein [Candidatus Omnitrophota bacterium]MDE2214567.1 DUF192 domain-containing protein [Candidatus Omnitrophota bacterium]MDE2231644.1 DUF192 domain-containing protein [Candidatus Omnitrophota bacterium]